MNNAIINFPLPANEPVKAYMPGSPERVALEKELERQSNLVVDIPIIIGGQEIRTGNTGQVTCPHDHKHVLATYHKVGKEHIEMAIDVKLKGVTASTKPSSGRYSVWLSWAVPSLGCMA